MKVNENSTDQNDDSVNTKSGEIPGDDQLNEIRHLLLGKEQTEINKLKELLDDPEQLARHISSILPSSITISSKTDEELINSLMPVVEKAINISVKKDPKPLVASLFPVIGPAIRKAISNAFREMIQGLNRALENSFSLQGLKWRFQAIATGKSFAEIVLINSLIYQVEQIYFIHRQTGLMLHQTRSETALSQDGDLVSAMFTAIQDFVHDSFKVERDSDLDTIEMGELTLLIEQGPLALLAGVIRGDAPEKIRNNFKKSLEELHSVYSNELQDFNGDVSKFEDSWQYYESCLSRKFKHKTIKISHWVWVILALPIIAIGTWMFITIGENIRWNKLIVDINSKPGVVVIHEGKVHGRYHIYGFRDPLSEDPETLFSKYGFERDNIESVWESYQALTPEFTLARATQILQPPDTVTLKVENNILFIEGTASREWINDALKFSRTIPGVLRFNMDNLVNADITAFYSLKDKIEEYFLYFELGKDILLPGQEDEINSFADSLKKLLELAKDNDLDFSVEIIGHTDTSGSESINIELSDERADRILNILIENGFERNLFKTHGIGSEEPLVVEKTEEDRKFNRYVSFTINIQESLEIASND